MAESCKRIELVSWLKLCTKKIPTISVLKWIRKISNGPIDICFFFEFITSGSCCAVFFFYCGRFVISWYPIPRLIGRYLFFDFLGSENSFQAKGEIEEEKGETTTEANEKEEEIKEEIFWSHASLYFQGRFLSLSPVQNVLLSRRPFLQFRPVWIR
jgi:hypothetical protein